MWYSMLLMALAAGVCALVPVAAAVYSLRRRVAALERLVAAEGGGVPAATAVTPEAGGEAGRRGGWPLAILVMSILWALAFTFATVWPYVESELREVPEQAPSPTGIDGAWAAGAQAAQSSR